MFVQKQHGIVQIPVEMGGKKIKELDQVLILCMGINFNYLFFGSLPKSRPTLSYKVFFVLCLFFKKLFCYNGPKQIKKDSL